jgi:hypothetical protein
MDVRISREPGSPQFPIRFPTRYRTLHENCVSSRVLPLIYSSAYTHGRSNADRGVRECALYAIARISHSPDGAEVVRGTDIWKYFVQLLNSRYPQTHRFTCQILGNLTVDTACLGFFGLGSYLRIVSMLRCCHTVILISEYCCSWCLQRQRC